MSYTKLEPQPPLRDPALAYEEPGPGLYDDGEVALRLDSGHYVVVSVTPKALENGAGVAFLAVARWTAKDGTTRLDGHRQHVERQFTDSAPAKRLSEIGKGDLAAGIAAFGREMIHALLGEPPTMRTLDGSGESLPLVPWDDEVRMNVDIRIAIAVAAESDPRAPAAEMLGL